ncbi:MAG: hypothetical protein KDA84_25545, partial [Planctomycetaceae bacterium]|nr:hypothetical protein [Planctomycetaceae bacterium]
MNDDFRNDSEEIPELSEEDLFNDFIDEAIAEEKKTSESAEDSAPAKEMADAQDVLPEEADLPEAPPARDDEVEIPKENPLRPKNAPQLPPVPAAMIDRESARREGISAEEQREREAQAIRGLSAAYNRMRQEIRKVIIGQHDIVDQI